MAEETGKLLVTVTVEKGTLEDVATAVQRYGETIALLNGGTAHVVAVELAGAGDDIRIAWNLPGGRLTAVHPDGSAPVQEVGFAEVERQLAPGGSRLIIGPTLGEIRAAFNEPV
jgi:hypothetical protein